MANTLVLCRYGKNETERNISGRSEADDVGVLVVEALLDHGADINRPDQYKLCPLHHAAMRGNIRVVECLASKEGIMLDVTDDQASTPLQIAATYGNKEVVKILLGRICRIPIIVIGVFVCLLQRRERTSAAKIIRNKLFSTELLKREITRLLTSFSII